MAVLAMLALLALLAMLLAGIFFNMAEGDDPRAAHGARVRRLAQSRERQQGRSERR